MESYKGWNLFKNYLTHNPNKQKKMILTHKQEH